MRPSEIDQGNFDQTESWRQTVIIDFWAPCAVLPWLAPVFEKASESLRTWCSKINSDEQQELAGAFNIRSISTLIVSARKYSSSSRPARCRGSAGAVRRRPKSLDMARCTPK